MKNRTATIAAATLAFLGVVLMSGPASADHRNNPIRINIPVHEHGPETLRLGRMIRHQRPVDLDAYRLSAVIIRNGPFSHGYASLRVGGRTTGRYFLPGRERILIPAPGRGGRDWRLRLGPGTQVRTITAVLEPRYAYGYRTPGRYPLVKPHHPRRDWHALNRGRFIGHDAWEQRRVAEARSRNGEKREKGEFRRDMPRKAADRDRRENRERREGTRNNPQRTTATTSDGKHSPHYRT